MQLRRPDIKHCERLIEILEMIKKGFQRFKIDGKIYKSDDLPELDKKFKHNIDIVCLLYTSDAADE